jgi:hypothetical protein
MEFTILTVLSFDITFPTVLRFLDKYLQIAGDDLVLIAISRYLTELALTDIRML